MARKSRRRSFGRIRRLPSGRHQASYVGPDLQRHNAPSTFEAEIDAEGWLRDERRLIEREEWTAPAARSVRRAAGLTLGTFATSWLDSRLNSHAEPLAPKTRQHYKWLLRAFISDPLGELPLPAITPEVVRGWYADLDTGKTAKAHAYSLLHSVMQTAVDEELITAGNPCRIKGAGKTHRDKEIRPATLDELEAIVRAMPERLRLLILLAAWCALRFGELTELRRKDVDLKNGVLRIKRGVVFVDGEIIVGDPKSAAGKRPVSIPPHLNTAIRKHLRDHAQLGPEGLLFWGVRTGKQLPHSSLLNYWNAAKHAARRDDMTPHALRHTGAVLAAQSGATIKELMARLGHTTSEMAIRYQHASEERDLILARKLSKLAKRNS